MNEEQIVILDKKAEELKLTFPDLTGSLTFHLCMGQPVPKVEVRLCDVTKRGKK